MIVPMSKFSFLVYHKDYQGFLDEVRQIGVIHLIEKQKDVSDEVQEKYDLIREINQSAKLLEKRGIEKAPKATTTNGKATFETVSNLQEELETKHQQLTALRKEMTQVAPWGDFSLDTLKKLQENGLFVKFYTVANRKFDGNWPQEFPIEVLGQHSGQIYFVLVHREGETFELDAEEMRRPERPISELKHYEQELEKDIARINKELDRHASESLLAIRQYQLELIESCDYKKALENTVKEADEKVMLIEGWVPNEKKQELVDYLEQHNFLYLVEKPTEDDKVPIMLKNQKFASKFEMLGELYSLPKYKELDLTPFFAPFYMLFFGFCLGDAGYGVLMAVVALLLKKRVQKELKQVMGLVFYLGVSTFIFGVISGVVFGIPLYETSLPVYSTLAARFEAQGTDINMLLFYLSLVLGGIQILFGLVLKAINETRQFGWKYAVGTLGWIVLLTGLVGLYGFSYLSGIEFGDLTIALYVLLGISGVMILLLNNMNRNVLMNFGVGLWNTYNMATGILGDLLSYIRLFALGISSAILGFVFNSLAVEMSGNIPVVSILFMVLILVIGHGINLFMSGLGAFVHPMRLTFVEFYKNAGFSGGGKKYHPFRKIT
jgi:V/A-type H+/Na+-transporting ATPase subunit I